MISIFVIHRQPLRLSSPSSSIRKIISNTSSTKSTRRIFGRSITTAVAPRLPKNREDSVEFLSRLSPFLSVSSFSPMPSSLCSVRTLSSSASAVQSMKVSTPSLSSTSFSSNEVPTTRENESKNNYNNNNSKKKMKDMNLFTAINNAMDIAMKTDDSCILFGEDVGFGGVFRCSQNLQDKYGKERVFNTPLSENGIAGMAIGYASMGGTAIGEIQFADYIFPAMDQIVNEMAKFRYRSGNQWNAGKVTIRTPCGAVGHGGHYHSQSPEAYLCHTPGLVVVMPSGPYNAKGLLLSSIRCPDPVIFLEPKGLYRTAIEPVPIDEDEDYEIELGKANVIQHGNDITIIGYGGHLRNVLMPTVQIAKEQFGISCELIDLQTLLPWDIETVMKSVTKTGKCIISHEAPITCGYGAEISASIQERCFASLEAPITRVCGYDTPFPLVFEKYYIPDKYKNLQSILNLMEYAK